MGNNFLRFFFITTDEKNFKTKFTKNINSFSNS